MDNNAYDEVIDDERRGSNFKAMQKLGIAEKDGPAFDVGEPEPLDEEVTGCMRYVEKIQVGLGDVVSRNGRLIQAGVWGILAILLHVFLGTAIRYDYDKAEPLFGVMGAAWVLILYFKVIKPMFGDYVYHTWYLPAEDLFDRAWKVPVVRWGVYLAVVAAIAVFLAIDTRNDRSRLLPLGGWLMFVCILFLFSTNPAKVNWRPVAWGFLLQFCMGLL
uniref:Concentrative nucleoside transporter N-terminal domain-containing protein n=1 Tax=Plectus sambesii TaxID=2011161 RepID=A0A914X902_9BILA